MLLKKLIKVIFIYSGISPGKKGTGNFLSFFLEKLTSNQVEYNLIAYNTPHYKFVSTIAKKLGLIQTLRTIYRFISQQKTTKEVENSKVFIFHPQSLGLKKSINLIKSNEVYFYVLDAFFFCIKSYNHIEGYKPCLDCLNDSQAFIHNKCKPLIFKQKNHDYLSFIREIEKNIERITFLTQNKNQSLLLRKKFGDSIKVRELGMFIDLQSKRQILVNRKSYDFVYHNTALKSKGLVFFIELAKAMPKYKFLIPYDQSELRLTPRVAPTENIDFVNMTWDNGLHAEVCRCKVVINPSVWSSPVEGSLLKSIYYNGRVAMIPSLYSFTTEIPENVLISLNEDISKSASQLEELVNNPFLLEKLTLSSKKWLENYRNSVHLRMDNFMREL